MCSLNLQKETNVCQRIPREEVIRSKSEIIEKLEHCEEITTPYEIVYAIPKSGKNIDAFCKNRSDQGTKGGEKEVVDSDNGALHKHPDMNLKPKSKRGKQAGRRSRLWKDNIKRKQQLTDKTKQNPNQQLAEKEKSILEMEVKEPGKRKGKDRIEAEEEETKDGK